MIPTSKKSNTSSYRIWHALNAAITTGWTVSVKTISRIPPRFALTAAAVTWCIWVAQPYFLLGPLPYVRGNELGDAVFPQIAYIVKMLQMGQFSFWLPAQGAGTDLLGNFNSPFVNVLLFVLFPGALVHSLVSCLVVIVATVCTYRLLRNKFGCARWSACLGAALYGQWFLLDFSGIVYTWAAGLIFAVAPLIFQHLLALTWPNTKALLRSALLGLLIACGGHYTWSIFILGATFFGVAILAPKRIFIWLPHAMVICACVGIVQFPLFLANVETAPFSARMANDMYYFSSSIHGAFAGAIEFILTSWTYGRFLILGDLFALFAALTFWRWPPRTLIILTAMVFVLPFTDSLGSYILSLLHLGGFRYESDGSYGGPFEWRLSLLMAFFVSLSFALGLDFFWKTCFTQPFPYTRARLLCISAALVLIAAHVPSAVRVIGRIAGGMESMRAMALDGMNFAGYYNHPDLTQLADQNPNFSDYRVATVQLNGPDTWPQIPCCSPREGSLFAGFQAAYGFEIADAYMSNLPARYVDYWDIAIIGRPAYPRLAFDKVYRTKFELPQQAYVQKLYLFEPLNSKTIDRDGCIRTSAPIDFESNYNLAMLSLANVKYIVSGVPLRDPHLHLLESTTRNKLQRLQCTPPELHRAAFYQSGLVGRPLYIYRNELAHDRVFAPSRLEIFAAKEQLFHALMARSVDDLAATAVVQTPDLPDDVPTGENWQPVQIDRVLTPRGDRVLIDVATSTGGPIVVADAFSPYWQASADGKPLKVFPAYYAFIGIWVPPDAHQIELRYLPPYSKWLP